MIRRSGGFQPDTPRSPDLDPRREARGISIASISRERAVASPGAKRRGPAPVGGPRAERPGSRTGTVLQGSASRNRGPGRAPDASAERATMRALTTLPSPASDGGQPVPVLATYFSVRRGRDPFFKFFMRKIFPRQVKGYEEKFGMRFLGWYNVAYGWDFDNVILLELPGLRDDRQARRGRGHPAPSAIEPASGCSSATTRCSSANGWGPTSSTTGCSERGRPRWIRSRQPTCSASSPPTPASSGTPSSSSRRAAPPLPRRERRPDQGARRHDLIDEDPDYLSVAPDVTFRSRSRYQDEITGEWVRRPRSSRAPPSWSSSTTRPTSSPRSPRRRASRPACPTSRPRPTT